MSRTVEEEVLKQTMEDKEYSVGRNERLVEVINSGSGVEKLDTDELFREVLRDQEGNAIDPESIYEEYASRSKARDMERNHPLGRLKEEREKLIRDFGSKPVTPDCLGDIVRLNMLDNSIKQAEKLPKDSNQVTKEQNIEFSHMLADVHRPKEVNDRMTPERRRAMEKVSQAPQNAGKAFTLDQMANMVNDQVRLNQDQKKPQIQ